MNEPAEAPSFALTQDTRIKLSLVLLWSLLVAAAIGTAWGVTLRATVERHSADIQSLQTEVRATRELLIEMRADLKYLRREADAKRE